MIPTKLSLVCGQPIFDFHNILNLIKIHKIKMIKLYFIAKIN